MDSSDEMFIAQFEALSAEPPLTLPPQGVSTRNWSRCILARVLTDRSIVPSHFSQIMLRVWAARPDIEVVVLTQTVFLIQFTDDMEVNRTMQRGIWSYRGDAVILEKLSSQPDMTQPLVQNMEVWVQCHGIPLDAITNEGIIMLAETKLGTMLSEPIDTFLGGQKFYRIKMLLPVDQALKDRLEVTHPNKGPINIFLFYERITKACLFCGKPGHEIAYCVDQVRMQRLSLDPRFKNRPGIKELAQPKVGKWITNPALIPLPDSQHHSPNPNLAQRTAHTTQQTYYTVQNQYSATQHQDPPRGFDPAPEITEMGLGMPSTFAESPNNPMGSQRFMHPSQLPGQNRELHNSEFFAAQTERERTMVEGGMNTNGENSSVTRPRKSIKRVMDESSHDSQHP